MSSLAWADLQHSGQRLSLRLWQAHGSSKGAAASVAAPALLKEFG